MIFPCRFISRLTISRENQHRSDSDGRKHFTAVETDTVKDDIQEITDGRTIHIPTAKK